MEQRPNSTEKTGYSLQEKRDGGHQWVYKIKPQLESAKVEALAAEIIQVFPAGVGRYGFLKKLAVRLDGKTEDFADFGINKSVPEDERDQVLGWVKSKMVSL